MSRAFVIPFFFRSSEGLNDHSMVWWQGCGRMADSEVGGEADVQMFRSIRNITEFFHSFAPISHTRPLLSQKTPDSSFSLSLPPLYFLNLPLFLSFSHCSPFRQSGAAFCSSLQFLLSHSSGESLFVDSDNLREHARCKFLCYFPNNLSQGVGKG